MEDENADRNYRDKDTLQKLYREKDMNQYEIAEKFNTTQVTIGNWIRKYNITKKYKDRELLEELYHEKLLTMSEIANEVNASRDTVTKYMNKFNIEREPSNTRWFLKQPVTFSTNKDGYEIVKTKYKDNMSRAYIHRLVAIAKGNDPQDVFSGVEGNHTHHINEIPWDNRPENLELVSMPDHRSHHAKKHMSDD